MEQEQILSTLTETLGNTQFSERTLTAYIESHPVAEGAEPDDAYFNAAKAFFTSLQGQYAHDVAEGIKRGMPPAPKPAPKPSPKEAPSEIPELKELREKISILEKAQSDRIKAEEQSALIRKVKEAMKKSNATDEYVLTQTFKGIELDAAKSVSDLATEMLEKYDAEYKACRGQGAQPRQTQKGGDGGNGQSRAAQFFERKRNKEGWKKK